MRALRLMRFFKLARLSRAIRIVDRLQDRVAINYSMLTIFNAIVIVAFVSHWMASTWYLVARWANRNGNTNNWVTSNFASGKLAHERETTFDLYISSFYFAVMTMSTIGYGDITPVNAT